MKRLLTVAVVLVAVPLSVGLLFYGWALFLFVWCYAESWPSQEKMVQSGYAMIPEARQIDDFFGPAWHSVCNYKEPDIAEWRTVALFAGRYELTMWETVQIDRRSGNVVKVVGTPMFHLFELHRITADPGLSITYEKDQPQFGFAEWQKVVAAGGDFSVIGIRLKQNKPVSNFDAYKANMTYNGLKMRM